MNTQNFPVTFEFFKKYTKNHGKYINFIYDFIKTTHPIQYSKRNTTSGNDWALRKYYEKFYLQTAIRRMCPLEFKPVPNFIKDKILQVTNNNRVSNDNTEAAAAPAVTQPGVVLNSNSNQVENSNQVSHDISKAAAAPAVTRPGEVQNSNQVSHDISKAAPSVSQPGELQNTYTAKDDEEHQQIPTTSKNSQLSINTLPLKLPVTYENFKKHTYYNEIVDKMLKLKSQGNDKLYEELKSSKESKKRALQDYYEAFYCQPKIRENYPIRFKPMPKKLKETFLQIPLADDCNSSANRQDCFVNSDNVEDVPKAINDDKDQEIPSTSKNSQLSSNNNGNRQDCFMNSNNVEDVPMGVNDDKDAEPLTLTTTTTKPSINQVNGKALMPFKHSCPMSCANFRLYTNIEEVLKEKYVKRYGNVKFNEKLKDLAWHYWLIFYLKPEYRTEYPLNQVKVKEEFLDKKAKVFTTTLRNAKIPYNNDDSKKENAKPDSNTGNKPAAKDVDPEETSTSRQYDDYAHLPLTPPNKRTNDDSSQPVSKRRKTMSAAPEEQSGIENNNSQKETLKQHEQATNTKNGKHNVEILENLLLVSPPPPPTIRSSVSCSDKRCIFSDISFDDFLQNTNILEMSPQPLSNSELVTIYKKTLYGLVAHKNIPDELVINGKFIADHLLYKDLQICENCKTSFDFLEMEETDQSSHNAMDVHPSTSRSTSNSAGIQKLKRIYCLKKLSLNPLQKCADQLYPLSFEQFKQSSKIPLKKILKEIFNDNNEIIEMFLKDNELRNQLLYYYYINYHTKPSFKTKYPSKFCNTEKLNGDIRQTDEETNKHKSNSITTEEPKKHTDTLNSTTLPAKEPINNQIDAGNLQMSSDNSDGKDKSLQKSNPLTHQIVQASPAATTKLGHAENQTITDIPLTSLKSQHQNTISADLPQSSSPKNVEYLDKAKRIIFRNKAKEHCLPYILRTSFGLKQNIIIAVFSMTYEEFHNLTRIYEGNSLYNDSHIMQCAYKCIFQTNQVWPTILYMTLHDLCQFLKMKNIIIQNYSTMLKYISPKFLHWSNLRKCTNFEDSVCLYYRKRTGKILNINDEKLLNNECNDYYNRCWIHEKWIEQTPLLNSELVKELEENQSDVPVFDMSLVQEISATIDDAAEMAPANAGEEMPLQNINESPVSDDKNNTSPITQQQQPAIHVDKINLENATPVQNYVLLPNTQQQIDMLPSETTTVDPLQRDSPKNVENLDDGDEPVSFSELSDKIKIEPIEGKLLNNFNFYENDNGEINVSPRDEEIVIVDGTDTSNEENLPPSQIDFSEFCQTSKKLSGSGVLPRSDNSDRSSLTDIRQRLPSSAESTKAQHNSKKLMELNYDSSSSSSTSESPKSTYNKICLEVQELLEQILIDDDDKKTNVNSNLPQLQEEKGLVLQISDDSDGNSDEMSTIIGNQNVDSNNTKDKLKQLPSSLDFQNFDYATTTATSVQQPSFISPSPRNEATFMEAQRLPSALEDSQNAIEIVQQNNVQFSKSSTGIPDIERYVTIRKKSKNITNLQVATVKPIQKSSEHVPQRQHHIRPLPGASVAQASTTTSHSTQQIQQNQTTNVAQIEAATPSLIITSSTEKQSQQTSPPRTYIHISQELTTDCTVFNNSSLLKIADHNYHRQSQQTSSPTTSISQTTRTSPRIITRKVLNYNQSNEASVSTTHLPSTSSSISAETNRPVEITTRKSPLNKDNNLKVNTLTNSNLVATIPPTVHFSGNETMHKLCVYRDLNSIHYFKEISSQHIATYLLPIAEFGKSYFEATIACENFKTRLCNNTNISTIFPYWSQSLQRDFFLVLNDVKEFHFNRFEYDAMQKVEDLPSRILFWLLYTAAKISHCQIITETNSTEFSRCETVQNFNNPSYKRLPFTSLKNSVKPSLLVKLEKLKRDLKSS